MHVQRPSLQPTGFISQCCKTTQLASLGTLGANQLSRFPTAMGTRTTHTRTSANRFPFWSLHSDVRVTSDEIADFWTRVSVHNISANHFQTRSESLSDPAEFFFMAATET